MADNILAFEFESVTELEKDRLCQIKLLLDGDSHILQDGIVAILEHNELIRNLLITSVHSFLTRNPHIRGGELKRGRLFTDKL